MVFEFLRRGVRTAPRQDDQPSTEPIEAVVATALLQDPDSCAHTSPLPLPRKKPRVSFNTVTSTTFVKDGEDPFELSTPQERELSPLLDSSLIFDRTPPGQAAAAATGKATAGALGSSEDDCGRPSCSTPMRSWLSDASDMAVSSPGEMAGEVTGDIADLSQMVADDEMEEANVPSEQAGLSPVPAGWNNFPRFQDQKNLLSDDEESVASRRLEQQGAVNSQLLDTAHLVSSLNISARNADEASTYDTVASSIKAGSIHPAQDVEMSGASSLQDPPRLSVAESAASFDFEAVNQEFDRRVGIAPQSSPVTKSRPFAQSPLAQLKGAREIGPSSRSMTGGAFQGLGYGLLANLQGVRSASPRVNGSRSPSPRVSGSGNRFGMRSPKQDFAKWSQGSGRALELSQPVSESGQSSQGSTLVQHPIQQLTATNSSLVGTRTRMSWEEFMSHGMHSMRGKVGVREAPNEHDEPQASALEPRAPGCASAVFDCPRAQELHDMLQQRRAEVLENFVSEVGEQSEQRRNEYTVAKQMWDRSTDMPAVAAELIQVAQDEFEKDAFLVRMKDWQQKCKEEAWLSWYDTKKQWLQGDLEVVKQHTQTLKDEVQRLSEAKHRCEEMLKEIHGGSKTTQHRCDLHEIKYAYQTSEAMEVKQMGEEQRLLQRELPQQQAALEAQRRKNAELEHGAQEMKQRIQVEQDNMHLVRRESLQQQLHKNCLEKQMYAHTCIIRKETSGAVCIEMRGNVKLWVEKVSEGSQEAVRVSVQHSPSSLESHMNPCVRISPELSRGWLACAWSRTLAMVSGSSEKLLGPVPGSQHQQLESAVPRQQLHRFLRLLDVEVLHMTDQLSAMRNLHKDVPEVHQLTAEFSNSPLGDQPSAKLTVLLSVLRSHTILPDGTLRSLRSRGEQGKFDAVQCVVKFNADLATLHDVSWTPPSIEHVLGHLNPEFVAQAEQNIAPGDSFQEVLKATVGAMRKADPMH